MRQHGAGAAPYLDWLACIHTTMVRKRTLPGWIIRFYRTFNSIPRGHKCPPYLAFRPYSCTFRVGINTHPTWLLAEYLPDCIFDTPTFCILCNYITIFYRFFVQCNRFRYIFCDPFPITIHLSNSMLCQSIILKY